MDDGAVEISLGKRARNALGSLFILYVVSSLNPPFCASLQSASHPRADCTHAESIIAETRETVPKMPEVGHWAESPRHVNPSPWRARIALILLTSSPIFLFVWLHYSICTTPFTIVRCSIQKRQSALPSSGYKLYLTSRTLVGTHFFYLSPSFLKSLNWDFGWIFLWHPFVSK